MRMVICRRGGSRVSDIDSSEISVVGRRSAAETFSEDLSDGPPPSPAHAKPDREGLPSGYRMRADAHYVEQLASRRADKDKGEGRPAVVSDGDADGQAEARERRTEKLLALIGDEIASIGAAASLLTVAGTSLARRLSVDLIRAQAWRASWLVRSHALIDGAARGHSRPRPVSALVEQIRQGLGPEFRLAGVRLQIHASDWNASVSVDEASIVAGVTGAVMATLGILGHAEGAVVSITFDVSGDELRSIEVAQDDVMASPALGQRFGDLSWTDRPGGFTAAIGALSARAAAQQHGGSASVAVGERHGTAIRLSLARTH
jgi:hypothetical protein